VPALRRSHRDRCESIVIWIVFVIAAVAVSDAIRARDRLLDAEREGYLAHGPNIGSQNLQETSRGIPPCDRQEDDACRSQFNLLLARFSGFGSPNTHMSTGTFFPNDRVNTSSSRRPSSWCDVTGLAFVI
jgi:hypothetical protein